ncbi:MAG: YtxH domain-containing protein [Flavipsychrobacter sp.]|nr:YtxH domain-containing protein [Flavipsychrobacter sp.]
MRTTRLLALAAIGAGVALLFTTKKGKALRSDIADKSGELLKRLNTFAHENGKEGLKRAKQLV